MLLQVTTAFTVQAPNVLYMQTEVLMQPLPHATQCNTSIHTQPTLTIYVVLLGSAGNTTLSTLIIEAEFITLFYCPSP